MIAILGHYHWRQLISAFSPIYVFCFFQQLFQIKVLILFFYPLHNPPTQKLTLVNLYDITYASSQINFSKTTNNYIDDYFSLDRGTRKETRK